MNVAPMRPVEDVRPEGKSARVILLVFALAGCAAPPVIRGAENPILPTGRESGSRDLLDYPQPTGDRPLLAIVIDDAGESIEQLEPFLDIPVPLSFSVLSAASHPREVALSLEAQGRDVLAHIPMEPLSADHMGGPGFLLTSMTTREIAKTLEWDLERVPGAKGVNNHMGSRFTRDRYAMAVVLAELKKRGLYFLDSRTDPETVGREAARNARVPFLERDVFLDNDPHVPEINRMMNRAVEVAHERGCAIAIGHPRPNTAAVIRRFALDPDRDVDVIPVTRLLGLPCRDSAHGTRPAR
ncbi:MAG: divergent polysaccharide deacetylase family protein [Deltaproteobacteria bacterium]|nr:divergent polysaccharide deacetylase family protein [Deltaproteobacteria bacterium]